MTSSFYCSFLISPPESLGQKQGFAGVPPQIGKYALTHCIQPPIHPSFLGSFSQILTFPPRNGH